MGGPQQVELIGPDFVLFVLVFQSRGLVVNRNSHNGPLPYVAILKSLAN